MKTETLKKIFIRLFFVFIFFILLDILSTWVSLTFYGNQIVEGNPIVAPVIKKFGVNIGLLITGSFLFTALGIAWILFMIIFDKIEKGIYSLKQLKIIILLTLEFIVLSAGLGLRIAVVISNFIILHDVAGW